ncbi:MAG: MFS transporter [Casimicrobiaceae bacterium]|nr:MFS transporter [Casimicrobiaceae bacterium]MDW8312343.1 MFS transporter [Burkholderiales bacterium]
MATSLAALEAGGGALWVGVLTAMFNLVPAFLAIPAGRMVDRRPLREMLLGGTIAMAVAGFVAAGAPRLAVLATCACVIGLGWMIVAAAVQYAVGAFASDAVADRPEAIAATRVRAFSVMAMGFSVSNFSGPLIAGLLIDGAGFSIAFAVLGAVALGAAGAFAQRRLVRLPSSAHKDRDQPVGSARELLAEPVVRNTLITGAFITVGWDLYGFMVPVLGSSLGLSATQIGSVFSLFALAVFLVRFAMPWLTARLGSRGVIVAAMIVAGTTFIAFAFARSYTAMLALSFLIGLGLGSSQPIVLALLHGAAPPNRIGEVNGLRMTMIATSQWTMPLVFGILSAKTGLLPLFLLVGSGLLTGSWFARKHLPR